MDQRIEIVIELLGGRLSEGVTFDQLAQTVNLSLSRFQHIFKAETGMSPAHYLRILRMERAKELLETSFLPVKQIMHSLGVGDRSHFEREFKTRYGMTPAQCRLSGQPLSSVDSGLAQS